MSKARREGHCYSPGKQSCEPTSDSRIKSETTALIDARDQQLFRP